MPVLCPRLAYESERMQYIHMSGRAGAGCVATARYHPEPLPAAGRGRLGKPAPQFAIMAFDVAGVLVRGVVGRLAAPRLDLAPIERSEDEAAAFSDGSRG